MGDRKTERLLLSAEEMERPSTSASVARAADVLRAGGTVAFPTETVYGLGANALCAEAVLKIFAAKGRPRWDPLIAHVADDGMLEQMVEEVPPLARRLMNAFWPGPLTLLLRRRSAVPDAVTAGRALVGVRMPAHPVARSLIARAGVPIAAPSANRFGHTSPTTAEHVLHDLEGRIDVVLDGGATRHGLESSVVDASGEAVALYRPGIVTVEQLREVVGQVTVHEPVIREQTEPQALASPGLGMRHYAPKAMLVLVEAEVSERPQDAVRQAVARAQAQGETVGVMQPTGWEGVAGTGVVLLDWGPWEQQEVLARRLFSGLRQLDEAGVQVIVCPLPSKAGLGAALRDRLVKAAWKSA